MFGLDLHATPRTGVVPILQSWVEEKWDATELMLVGVLLAKKLNVTKSNVSTKLNSRLEVVITVRLYYFSHEKCIK